MAPSRKHFRAVAEAIAECTTSDIPNTIQKDKFVSRMAGIFADANSSFNSAKFRNACYEQGEESE